MDRRTYLRSLGVAGVAGVAGCLEAVPGVGAQRADGAVLTQPDNPLPGDVHPDYGEEVPHFSVPDALSGEEITPEQFEGERAFLITFIYTSCPDGACPYLLLQLREAQQAAREGGYEDDVAFLALTFDPEHDTPDVLRDYGDIQGVDYEADNWHFLRPESYEVAKDLLNEEFGLAVQRTDPDEHDEHDHGDEDDHENHFVHANLTLLVNQNGIIERAYPTRDIREDPELHSNDPDDIVEDLERVVEG